jgi:hypothetical protein
VPADRPNFARKLEPLIVKVCPFPNLPEAKAGRWGQGLTAEKMQQCVWVKPKLAENFEFREWIGATRASHQVRGASIRQAATIRSFENNPDNLIPVVGRKLCRACSVHPSRSEKAMLQIRCTQ